jgi:hypothetical protein
VNELDEVRVPFPHQVLKGLPLLFMAFRFEINPKKTSFS